MQCIILYVSLNNIYTKDTSLFRHTDIDESNTAKDYPVIVYVLGNEHKVRIDDAGGIRSMGNMLNPRTMTLKNGDVYTLGLGGKGRFEAVHDVVKGSNKSTKYPPITLPSGKVITDYTITFTFIHIFYIFRIINCMKDILIHFFRKYINPLHSGYIFFSSSHF